MAEVHALRCDHCGIQKELETHQDPIPEELIEMGIDGFEEHRCVPPGWIEVYIQKDHGEDRSAVNDALHFCSSPCVHQYFAPKSKGDGIPEVFRRL